MKTTLNQQNLEMTRYGMIAFIILVVGCLGGLAMGLGAVQHTATLILVVIPTMVTLSLLLAVSPMQWIYTAAIGTVCIDVCLILYYLVV